MDIHEYFKKNDHKGIIDRGSDTEWRDQLHLQDMNELRNIAKKVSTKISGTKQDVRDAIVIKLAVYEEMYKGMNKTELKDICQSLGLKGLSTLAKEALINKIIRSYFEDDKRGIPVATAVPDFATVESVVKDDVIPVKTPLDDVTKTTESTSPKTVKSVKTEPEVSEVKTEPEVKSEVETTESKKRKASIPKKVKTDVWNTYIGADINRHRCLCCKKTIISNTDFDVGHVVSEACGGTLEIGNLRPICAACNHAMGTLNMVEFVKKYGYFIG